jgi:hypothetical protein
MGLGLTLIEAQNPSGATHPEQRLLRIQEWLARKCPEELEGPARLRTGDSGEVELTGCLHPAAEPLEFRVRLDGRMIVDVRTTPAGPGYHLFVADLLRELGKDMSIQWSQPPPEVSGDDEEDFSCDDTEYYFTRDANSVIVHMNSWLRTLCAVVLEDAAGLKDGYALALPSSCGFKQLDVVNTPLGPRSVAWLQQTATDPSNGHDFFAWPNRGQNGKYFLGRALAHMWCSVCWRKPVFDGEAALLHKVDSLLKRAMQLDATLSLPWREWAEIRQLGGIHDSLSGRIAQFGRRTDGASPIGYRRYDRAVSLSHGWSVRLPGTFAEWTEEDAWCAGDGERNVRVTIFSVTKDGQPSDATEIVASRGEKESWEMQSSSATVVRRARFEYDVADECWHLHGLCAASGSLAVLTVTFVGEVHKGWATDVWRSLAVRRGR